MSTLTLFVGRSTSYGELDSDVSFYEVNSLILGGMDAVGASIHAVGLGHCPKRLSRLGDR